MIVPLSELDFFRRALAVYGAKEAVVCGAVRLTYEQLAERVWRWANAMRSLGVKKGDRVAILSQNCHRMIEAFFGAPYLGAINTPMNFRLVPSDFEYILNHSEAKVLIVEEGFEHLIELIRGKFEGVKHFILAANEGMTSEEGWLDYEQLLAGASPEPPVPETIDENETSVLLYTSGTTGKPKGVMLTHRNLFLNAMNAIIEFGVRDTDKYLHGIALFHCNGWGLPYAITGMGGTHVLFKKFEPAHVLEIIAREKVTLGCMAPTMINKLLNHPDSARTDLPRDMRIGTAGSPPPMAIIQSIQERLGWRIIQAYGLTETSPFLTVSKLKPHMVEWPVDEQCRVQTKTGYPTLGTQLRVVDAEGHDVPAGGSAAGEIIARSNIVMAGYWKQPEATEAAIVDGWFHTGDMATLDAEGYVEIVDRRKDIIISGGENISSIEVEGVIYQHPAVLEAAIVGVPDERWGEVPKGLVVVKEGADVREAELIDEAYPLRSAIPCILWSTPRLAPWSLTLVASGKPGAALRMPRACPVEPHASC